MNKKTIITCPYLGLAVDPNTNFGEPSDAQQCYSPQAPGAVELAFQQSVCLTQGYCDCKRFVAPKTIAAPEPAIPVAVGTTAQATMPVPTVQPMHGLSGQTTARMVEVGLWSVAALLVLATIYFALPLFSQMAVPLMLTRTSLAQVAVTPTITPTALSTGTPTATVLSRNPSAATQVQQPTAVPLVIPTPPADGLVLTLSPDPALTGWVVESESFARWGDRALLAGSLRNEEYISLLHFDFPNLPPGSQVVFAALELTGRDAAQLGQDGAWSLELMDGDPAKKWSDQSFQVFANTPALGAVGNAFPASELGAGRANDFVFDEQALNGLAQQLAYGGVTLRLRAANTSGDNLFSWNGISSGGGGLEVPTLYLVVLPKPFTVITNTPVPTNVFTAAAQVLRSTADAKLHGTPTPFPPGVATATPAPPTIFVPPPPTAANAATRIAESNYATAVAITTGTYTPTPKNIIIQYPTATPVLIDISLVVPPATLTPSANLNFFATPIPAVLAGKILVQSNRLGQTYANLPLVMDETGTVSALLSSMAYYDAAAARESFSPDRQRRAIVAPDLNDVLQIWMLDFKTNAQTQVTSVNRGIAYDPVWSPDGTRIAYVSTQTGLAEIFVYDIATQTARQLTFTTGANLYNQRPSWSPDSTRLVFKSNRDDITHFQIFMMQADGSGLKNISLNQYDETDPVWVKP